MKKILAASLALFAGLSFSAFAQDAATSKLEKVEEVVATEISVPEAAGIARVFIVGDSTASPFADDYYIPRFGFGTKVQDYLNPKKAAVVNLAVSGRSSKNFITDPGSGKNYELLKNSIRKGDFLFIAFGHNDEKLEDERYTNPNGKKEDAGSFQNSLYENYVKLAQNVGATPILVTPIVRLNKDNKYEGAVVHVTSGDEKYPGGDYPQAIRNLAKELNLPLVDQTVNTKKLYEKLGFEKASQMHAMTGMKPASLDTTHLNSYGASVVAEMLVQDAKKVCKPFKKIAKNGPKPKYDLASLVNPDYVEPGFGPPANKSGVFETSDPWWGSAFGNIGGTSKVADENLNEIVEIKNGVDMHSGAKDGSKDCGKIATSEDGILFYFQKLPVNKDFTFTADAKIKHVKSNNQVSFGLMVRDNVIIDTSIGGFNSNYAAAAPLKIKSENWTAGFARIDAALQENPHSKEALPAAGASVKLSITKKGSDVTVQYGSEDPVTYTVNLAEYDKENMYVGCFTSRSAHVEFTNISLK